MPNHMRETPTLRGPRQQAEELRSLGRPRRGALRIARLWQRNKTMGIGLSLCLALVLAAFAAPWLRLPDPLLPNMNERLVAPCLAHLFGTDDLGRDVLSRVIWGARTSLAVGIISVAIATVVGMSVGLVSAFKGGRLDAILMRAMDVLMCFPEIVLAIAVVASMGTGVASAIIAIGVVSIPVYARTVRAPALSEMRREYMEAARAVGVPGSRMLVRHLVPNCLSIMIVRATVSLGYAILTEASLSFLGLGVPPPTPSWGRMLNEGRQFMERAPWLMVFPGLAIALTVLGVNLLGDGLRDMLDPRLRRN